MLMGFEAFGRGQLGLSIGPGVGARAGVIDLSVSVSTDVTIPGTGYLYLAFRGTEGDSLYGAHCRILDGTTWLTHVWANPPVPMPDTMPYSDLDRQGTEVGFKVIGRHGRMQMFFHILRDRRTLFPRQNRTVLVDGNTSGYFEAHTPLRKLDARTNAALYHRLMNRTPFTTTVETITTSPVLPVMTPPVMTVGRITTRPAP
jgi:hypothetical protein